MDILEVKNLNLGFETEAGFKQALYDVSFSLQKGKIHALVGESGCGKTISAMSILQLLPKTAKITGGEVFFSEQETENDKQKIDILKLEKKELEQIRGSKIALIPQDPMTSLNPLYTIGNQLLEVIEKHQGLKGKEALQKAVEALELVQIPSAKERLNVYPHEFSGGMKQRAIIAMALACNAQVIIADEPTTALDVTIQAQIMEILANIKKETGTAILLITHDLELVQDCADKISVMYSGRIVESADTQSFFTYTNHPYSKALLKSRPHEKGEKLAIIEGQPPTIQQEISGCKFHPRCRFAMQVCSPKVPELKEIRPNHFSACFLNREEKR
ncbi:MAG: ABC transporter ATP-binding protein [Candidatus Gastranaerophilales bacterium]|nr:ABC transporter ATP-binding protein [Candidatus Gastranaerophilales bacterium]